MADGGRGDQQLAGDYLGKKERLLKTTNGGISIGQEQPVWEKQKGANSPRDQKKKRYERMAASEMGLESVSEKTKTTPKKK